MARRPGRSRGRPAAARRGLLSAAAGHAEEPARVLLVEDDPGDALMIGEAFRQSPGCPALVRVPDGLEALRLLRLEAGRSRPALPSLILLDLRLPRADGLDVLAALRADGRLSAIPVAVLSASRSPADIRDSFRPGAAAYLVKPPDYESLARLAGHVCAWLALTG